jgi:N-acetylmuramoyl-L-alanine amidase
VKRAPFVVLIGASMPSILVEVAFITHKQEGRLLSTTAYRQRLAESISDGIRRYQQALKKGSPVVLEHDQTRPAQPIVVPAGRDQLQ